jgi:hypothetical protein
LFIPKIGLGAGAAAPPAGRVQQDPALLAQPQPGTTPPQLGTQQRQFGPSRP